jgi:hypothetical protein
LFLLAQKKGPNCMVVALSVAARLLLPLIQLLGPAASLAHHRQPRLCTTTNAHHHVDVDHVRCLHAYQR